MQSAQSAHQEPRAEGVSGDPGNRVLEAIKERELRMRPRQYFVLRAILVALGASLLFLLLLYVASFVIYALHMDGLWFAPEYGISGWLLFFSGLPWGLLLLSLAILLLLAVILRNYEFVYHQPLFYPLFAFVVLIAIGGFFLGTTALHPDLSRFAARNAPVLENFYEYETAFPSSVHRGVIVSLGNGTFIIADGFGVTSSIVGGPVQGFQVGDVVLVFGMRRDDGVIKAFGVQQMGMATSTIVPTGTMQ